MDTKGAGTSICIIEVSVLKKYAFHLDFGPSGTKLTVCNREVFVLKRCETYNIMYLINYKGTILPQVTYQDSAQFRTVPIALGDDRSSTED